MLPKLLSKYKRIIRAKCVSLFQTKTPSGLFSLRFFIPFGDERNRLHRQIGFVDRGWIPVPFWLVLQLYLALRWRWRFSAPATDLSIKRFGHSIQSTEGIPITSLRRTVISLSRRYCIPPDQIFRFGLYRNPEAALNYIFLREVKPLHQLKNGKLTGHDHIVLQDKLKFARRCELVGLPSVPTLQLLSRERGNTLSSIDTSIDNRLFLKSRSGFRGIGAFSLTRERESLSGRLLSGEPLLSKREAEIALENLLQIDDALVQPFLDSHPDLAKLCPHNQPIILRTVTMKKGRSATFFDSYLRFSIVIQAANNQVNTHNKIDVLISVDAETGGLSRNLGSVNRLHPFTNLLEDRALQSLSADAKVPFWSKIVSDSLVAHEQFSESWAIAWDWIVTAESPYLLEGNIYWGMQNFQEIRGGLAEWI